MKFPISKSRKQGRQYLEPALAWPGKLCSIRLQLCCAGACAGMEPGSPQWEAISITRYNGASLLSVEWKGRLPSCTGIMRNRDAPTGSQYAANRGNGNFNRSGVCIRKPMGAMDVAAWAIPKVEVGKCRSAIYLIIKLAACTARAGVSGSVFRAGKQQSQEGGRVRL